MTTRLLVIAIEQLRDGKLTRVRRNVPWEQFEQLPEEQKQAGFLVLVEELRKEIEVAK